MRINSLLQFRFSEQWNKYTVTHTCLHTHLDKNDTRITGGIYEEDKMTVSINGNKR